jgi:hypothetical protein
MPFDPWQSLPTRPTTVAIHDDGNVPRSFFDLHVEFKIGLCGGA